MSAKGVLMVGKGIDCAGAAREAADSVALPVLPFAEVT